MDGLSMVRALAALLVVMGLLFALYWGLRRFSGFTPGTSQVGDLKISQWKQLDPRRKLAVIDWGEDQHLVLLGPTNDVIVASRRRPEEEKARPATTGMSRP